MKFPSQRRFKNKLLLKNWKGEEIGNGKRKQTDSKRKLSPNGEEIEVEAQPHSATARMKRTQVT